MSRPIECIVVLFLMSAAGSRDASGLSEGTHQIVNEQVVRQSSLGNQLSRLGLREGIDEIVNGQPVVEWFRLGGFQEDRPYCRSTRHFHDPLKTWPEAGLTTDLLVIRACGRSPFPSSAVWSQTVNQDPEGKSNGDWSWNDARRHFFAALTEPKPKRRDEGWADALRALGHLMHLVVDASVPEHVRNDTHMTESLWRLLGLRGHGNYEYWVSDQHKRIVDVPKFTAKYLRTPVSFDASLLKRPTEDAGAPIPIANLIDAGIYDGTVNGLKATTTTVIGIAEFANANFFSEDTWDGGVYQFPNPRTLVLSKHPIPDGSRARSYYKKGDGDGVAVDPVLAECAIAQSAFDSGVPSERIVKCTDGLVWQRVAEAMLPRAVGYARGIVDYFFRGKLAIRIAGAQLDAGGFRFTVRVTNRTDESMSGTLGVYYDTMEGERVPLGSWPISLEANGEAELPPLPAPLPAKPPAQRHRYLFVFNGSLGNEPSAVMGQWADIAPWYLRVLTFSSACARLPSNQFACEREEQGGGRALIPDADGVIQGGEDVSASRIDVLTVGSPLFPGDGPFLYLNRTQLDFTDAYLYRDGGGGRIRIAVSGTATPWGYCALAWGIPMGSAPSLLETTFFDPPLFARWAGDSSDFTPGTFTTTVEPQPDALLIRVTAVHGWQTVIGIGTFESSAQCNITSIQIADAE